MRKLQAAFAALAALAALGGGGHVGGPNTEPPTTRGKRNEPGGGGVLR